MKPSKDQVRISEIYEKSNWTLVWEYPIDDNQRNCFWHGGGYATATGRYRDHDWKIVFGSFGDVIGTLCDKNGKILADVCDKDNDGDRDEIEDYIDNDKDLEEAISDGRLELENNNWNETLVYADGDTQYGETDNDISKEDDIINAVLPPDALEDYLDGFLDSGGEE